MDHDLIAENAHPPETKTRDLNLKRDELASALLDLRFWADAHLPIYRSLICYDLTLVIAAHAGRARPVSLKRIYRLLPYSESHLRIQLRRLEHDNWIKLITHPTDARNRVIEPTQKFLDAYREYYALLARTVKRFSER